MWVRAAERGSRTGAPVVAADAYVRAAVLVEETRPIDAATNYERAAEAAERASSYDRSLAYAQHARRLFSEQGDSRASARADVAVGLALGVVGRLSEAQEILEAAVEELRAAPGADTVRAMRVLAANEIFAGSPRALDRALEALDLAQAVTVDSTELAAVFTCAGIASATTNRRSTAAALHREAARIAALAGARHRQGMALLNLADCQLMLEPREAAVTAREAVEVCRQIGSRRTLAVGATNLVSALLVIGDWDEAFDVLDAVLYGDGLDEQPHVHGEYAWAAGLRGDVVTARKHLEQMSAVRDSEDHQDQAGIATADAATAYAVGDWASAMGAARRMLLHLDAVGIGSEITFFAWSLGAIAAVEGGDGDATGEFVEFIDAQPVGHVPPLLRAFVDAVRGAMGRSSTAGSEYERTVD